MKKQLKRIACFAMAVVIGMSVAFPARADVVPVSLSPSSYVLSLLLNSMGIDVSLSALSSWVGSTETYQAYVEAGEQGTLSAWEQWCYDQGKSEGAEALRDSYESNIEWLGKLRWGDTVETIPTEKLHSSAKSLNDWTRSFPSYGTDNTLYKRSTAVQERPPYDAYPDNMCLGWYFAESATDSGGKYDQYFAYYVRTDYNSFLSAFDSSASYDNLVGYMASDGKIAYLYDTNTGKEIDYFRYQGFRYRYLTNSYVAGGTGMGTTRSLNYKAIKNTPIPIFNTADEMYAYTSGGHVDAINDKDKSGLKAKAVNPALQKTSIGTLNGLALPADENTAKKNLESVNMGTDIDTIIKALTAAGLVIDKGIDVPDESESAGETTADDADKKTIITSLGKILDKLEAIPGEIANFFTLDTASIDVALKDLQATFEGKFEVLEKLVNIFKDTGRTFSDTPPVFKMQTPDCLRFAIHEDYITVLDLTGYKELFFWVRGIMAASIWFAFGKWLLDQFDVKFHIG